MPETPHDEDLDVEAPNESAPGHNPESEHGGSAAVHGHNPESEHEEDQDGDESAS